MSRTEENRKYYEKNKERVKARRRYRYHNPTEEEKANFEAYQERTKKCRAERCREYYLKNKVHIQATKRKWYRKYRKKEAS